MSDLLGKRRLRRREHEAGTEIIVMDAIVSTWCGASRVTQLNTVCLRVRENFFCRARRDLERLAPVDSTADILTTPTSGQTISRAAFPQWFQGHGGTVHIASVWAIRCSRDSGSQSDARPSRPQITKGSSGKAVRVACPRLGSQGALGHMRLASCATLHAASAQLSFAKGRSANLSVGCSLFDARCQCCVWGREVVWPHTHTSPLVVQCHVRRVFGVIPKSQYPRGDHSEYRSSQSRAVQFAASTGGGGSSTHGKPTRSAAGNSVNMDAGACLSAHRSIAAAGCADFAPPTGRLPSGRGVVAIAGWSQHE